ncbi:phage baseplate protein [Rhizobium leguminosarum]|uniref:T4 family baseplate hub assembly chaperone n=1 Tax=Rhizobium leguminosarum TaxID=384 RepID=UPI00140FFA2D|nr:phage baseplate protein [Rhizobium leguminosarum]QIO61599.1 phage baseplate protein [Rhizobium leguminosarum bv. trifolii]
MTVTPNSLLEMWEHASRLTPTVRPLALLAFAMPAAHPDTLAELPLGVRDAHLLRLRQALFGDHIDCLTDCPACRGQLEFTVSAGDLLWQADETGTGEYWLDCPNQRVRFRPPNSADLLALSHFEAESDAFQFQMLARCVIDIEGPDDELTALPRDVLELLAKDMERRDPLAAIWLDLSCLQCGHAWQSLFDIASLLWADVDRWARMHLHEVHLFARAYGWTERDVLQLSSARRAYYLGMIGS